MKKVILVIATLALCAISTTAQTPKFKLIGGAFIGTNGATTLLGFPGPKLTTIYSFTETNLEIGVVGVPGFFLEEGNNRLGLSLGPVISVSEKDKKLKFIFGAMFFKTKTWYVIPGVGITF